MIEQSAGSEKRQEGLLPLSNRSTYPAPLATHEQVAAAPKLFLHTLHHLHEELKTTFTRTPTVAGKELDLHLLYLQVTRLGGLAIVIANKRWTTVSEPFQFPSSFTSKSWTLRKVYSRLLHDYEQVYFHGNRGLPIPPPPGPDGSSIEGGAAMTSSSSTYRMLPAAEASRPLLLQSAVQPADGDVLPPTPRTPISKKRRLDLEPTPPALTAFAMSGSMAAPALLPAGTPVHGIVDGHFDLGYTVTITVGNSEFQGVLYRPPEDRLHYQGSQAPSCEASPGRALNTGLLAQGTKVLQPRQQPEAQSAPKLSLSRNRTAFTMFSLDVHDMVKKQLPAGAALADIEGMIWEMWEGAPEGQRQPYMDAASAAQEQLFSSSPKPHQQAQDQDGIAGTEHPEASGSEPSSGHQKATELPLSRIPSIRRSGDALTSMREMLREDERAVYSNSISRQPIANPQSSVADQQASLALTRQSLQQHGDQPSTVEAGLQLPSQGSSSWKRTLGPLMQAPSPDPFSLVVKRAKAILPSSRVTLASRGMSTPAASQSQDSSQSSLGLDGLRSMHQYSGFPHTFGGLVRIPAQSESLPQPKLWETPQSSTGSLLNHLGRLDPSMAGAGFAAGLRLPLSFSSTPIQGMDVSQLAAFARGMGDGMHPFAAASSGPGFQASSGSDSAAAAHSFQPLAMEPARQASFQSAAHLPRRPLAMLGPIPAHLTKQLRVSNIQSSAIQTPSKAIP